MSNEIVKTFCILLMIVLYRASALACGCGPIEHACQAYSATPIIFVGTITGLGEKEASSMSSRSGSYAQKIQFRVDESFKGPDQGSTMLATFEHVASSCGSLAPEFAMGAQYLFWASADDQGGATITDCTPTKRLEDAAQFISELRELRAGGGPTYIFGTVYRDHDLPVAISPEDLEPIPLIETKVTVSSRDHNYSAITDDKGSFVVPLEGAGSYSIRADLPHAVQNGGIEGEIALDAHDCVEASLSLRYAFPITGRVVDMQGLPLRGVNVDLVSARSLQGFVHAFTDADGRYALSPSEPGQYFVAINWDNAPSKDSPFATTFYPGVRDAQSATNVDTDQTPIELSSIRLSAPKQCIAQFRIEDRDRKPAKGTSLMLKYFPEQYWHPTGEAASDGTVTIKLSGPGPIYVVASRQPGLRDELRSEEQTLQSCPTKVILLRMTKMIHAY